MTLKYSKQIEKWDWKGGTEQKLGDKIKMILTKKNQCVGSHLGLWETKE